MDTDLKYQLRVTLAEEFAEIARANPEDPKLAEIDSILKQHGAQLKCQFDAFADYVAAAEDQGTEDTPLYRWTKATIENPAKKAKYTKSFTIYAGGEEVYEKEIADNLETAIRPMVGGEIVTSYSRHDTDPAHNPQPPKRFRDAP